VLVYDMHNEYGFDDTASDTGKRVVGLHTKFPNWVRVVGLGGGALIRGQAPDFNLEIARRDIAPADIEMLTGELNLKETTPPPSTLVDRLQPGLVFAVRAMRPRRHHRKWGRQEGTAPTAWLTGALRAGVNVMAAEGLHSKLGRLFHKEYIVEQPAADVIGDIIKALNPGSTWCFHLATTKATWITCW
jgi:hypothetical protein